MKVLHLGTPSLREKSVPVELFTDELSAFVDQMFVTMKEEEGIGLAAPQVGKNIRLFIVEVEGQQYTFINPVIIGSSETMCGYEEGCLSIPGLYETVMRPDAIDIQYQDLRGKYRRLHAEGLLARVIQHENDHLNGVLFIDRLHEEQRERALEAYQKKPVAKKRRRVAQMQD